MVDHVALDLYVRTTFQDAQVARRQIEKVRIWFDFDFDFFFLYFRLRRAIVLGPEVMAGCGRDHKKKK